MSFITRILDWLDGGDADGSGADLPVDRLASAALLVHVARVDGSFGDGERERLRQLLADRHNLSQRDADALVRHAESYDFEVDDVAELVEAVKHGTEDRTGRGVLSLGYAVAAADGSVAEFEEDLLWRMGRLLGFDDQEIAVIRAESVGPPT